MVEQAINDFLMLFATIHPIGALALFVSLTFNLSAGERRATAFRAVLYAGSILIAFLLLGQLLLSGLGVRLVSFQLAGGVILFLLGLQMVFGTGVAAQRDEREPDRDPTIFPLALPAIAGPGSIMAIVLLTDNHRQSLLEQAVTGVMLVVVLLITLLVLLFATPIHRVLGHSGVNLLSRVMGLILAALAAEQIVAGLELVIQQLQGT